MPGATAFVARRRHLPMAILCAGLVAQVVVAAGMAMAQAPAEAGGDAVGFDRLNLEATDISVPGWVLREVRTHPEFARFFFVSEDGQVAGVEATAEQGQPGGFEVQAAPDHDAPPAELVVAVRRAIDTALGGDRVAPSARAERAPEYPRLWYALIGCVLLAMVLVGTIRQGWPEYRSQPGRGRLAVGEIAAAVVAFSALLWFAPDPLLIHDVIRDFMLARDCQDGYGCLVGAPMSAGGLSQGALWSRLLGMSFDLLGSVQRVYCFWLGVHALGAALLFSLSWRVTQSWRTAAMVAGLWIGFLLRSAPMTLWNPTLSPTAAALFAVWAYRAMTSGRVRDVGLAAVGLVMLSEGHMLAFAVLPLWCGGLVARAQHPAKAVVVTITVALGAAWLASPSALTQNLLVVAKMGAILPGATFLLCCCAVGWWLRRRAPAAEQVALLVGVLYVGAVCAASAVVWRFVGSNWQPSLITVRYLTPGVGLLALGLAMPVKRLLHARRTSVRFTVATLLVSGLLWTLPGPREPDTDWRNLEVVSSTLRGYGDYDSLAWSLHGLNAWLYLRVVGFQGRVSPHESEDPAEAVMMIHGTGDPPDPHVGWEAIPLDGEFLLLRTYSPVVKRSGATVVYERNGETGSAQLVRGPVLWTGANSGGRARWRDGRLPTVPDQVGVRRFSFPVGVRDNDLRIHVLNSNEDGCRVQVARVDDVPHNGPLPSASIVLRAGDETGRLEIEFEGPDCHLQNYTFPSWLELRLMEEWVIPHLDATPLYVRDAN